MTLLESLRARLNGDATGPYVPLPFTRAEVEQLVLMAEAVRSWAGLVLSSSTDFEVDRAEDAVLATLEAISPLVAEDGEPQ